MLRSMGKTWGRHCGHPWLSPHLLEVGHVAYVYVGLAAGEDAFGVGGVGNGTPAGSLLAVYAEDVALAGGNVVAGLEVNEFPDVHVVLSLLGVVRRLQPPEDRHHNRAGAAGASPHYECREGEPGKEAGLCAVSVKVVTIHGFPLHRRP